MRSHRTGASVGRRHTFHFQGCLLPDTLTATTDAAAAFDGVGLRTHVRLYHARCTHDVVNRVEFLGVFGSWPHQFLTAYRVGGGKEGNASSALF